MDFEYPVNDRYFGGQFSTLASRDMNSTFPLRYDPSHPETNELTPVTTLPERIKWVAVTLTVLLVIIVAGVFWWERFQQP